MILKLHLFNFNNLDVMYSHSVIVAYIVVDIVVVFGAIVWCWR